MSFVLGALLLVGVTAITCALPGAFVVLRRDSMLVDAMSHAVLPGIVFGFLLTHNLNSPLLLLGAAAGGVAVVWGNEWLRRTGLIAGDAANGLIFPALFSVGVLLISAKFSGVHLDTHTVLVGDVNLAAFTQLSVAGVPIGPASLYVMVGVLVATATVLALGYTRLVVSTFDHGFAQTVGLRPTLVHATFMLLVAVTVTAAFHVVGSILVLALVVVPAASARIFARTMQLYLLATVLYAALGAALGFWVAYLLDAPTSAVMAVCYGVLFGVTLGIHRVRQRRSSGRAVGSDAFRKRDPHRISRTPAQG